MQLKEIMTQNVESITPDTTVQEAAKKMATLDIGFLPVIEADFPVGVVTDRDIAVRVVATGRDSKQCLVRDIMSLEVETMSPNETVEAAAHLMEQKQIRRILVRDEAQHIVGIVSLGDLAVSTHDQKLSGEALEKVSEPTKPSP